jgi:hypothetical protein
LHEGPSAGRLFSYDVSEREINVSLPLDSEGFLRRECPTCEREFKWRPSEDADDESEHEHPASGYFCPYCAVQSPDDSWWTKAQLDFVQAIGAREVLGPELKRLAQSAQGLGRASGGSIEARVEAELPDEPDPLQEQDDMRRIDFSCHPSEPVKVLDEWDQPVHCLLCGQTAG